MKALVRTTALLALLGGLLYLAAPWAGRTWYLVQLNRMAPPASLPMPIASLTAHALRDTWHAPRGSNRRHEGIDIFARRGTPIVSTTEGIVLRVGESALGGNVVWVLGPAGQRHYYAHMNDASPLDAGQRIGPGTVLGAVGNTGNASTTPPHLHYGIYTRDGALNPYPLLANRPDDKLKSEKNGSRRSH